MKCRRRAIVLNTFSAKPTSDATHTTNQVNWERNKRFNAIYTNNNVNIKFLMLFIFKVQIQIPPLLCIFISVDTNYTLIVFTNKEVNAIHLLLLKASKRLAGLEVGLRYWPSASLFVVSLALVTYIICFIQSNRACACFNFKFDN